MKHDLSRHHLASEASNSAPSPWLRLIIAGGALIIFLGMLLRPANEKPSAMAGLPKMGGADSRSTTPTSLSSRTSANRSVRTSQPTAEEIVAGKVIHFGRKRREIVVAIAERRGEKIPSQVEAFFDAVEAGDWEGIEARFSEMAKRSGQYEGSTHARELDPYWMAVLDAYGAAEQAHEWPAAKLLDYGNAVLDSLRPGMVYVGGTDYGRWIPALLSETGEAEPHIAVTQNAFADGRYLEYINTLYGDRLTTLTPEDSSKAFKDYMDDARRRLEHDQEFSEEPKQVRPGEDIRVIDGKVQVSGQVAVMSINERLLQALMARNPDLSFAIAESSPLKGTYADARPLGPVMELGRPGGPNNFTPERATESAESWRDTAQRISSELNATDAAEVLKAYSHDAVAAANLLSAHN